jgi:chaperonin GroEL (HSP60 family)
LLEKAMIDDLGEAKKVQITVEITTIIDGAGRVEDALHATRAAVEKQEARLRPGFFCLGTSARLAQDMQGIF